MIKPGRELLKAIRSIQRKFATRKILVVGDSHAKIFRHFMFLRHLPRIHFTVATKGGATASGLATPTSKTQAYKRFREALDTIPRDLVMLQLGEVDTGYVIWYRARKHNASVEEMFDLAIKTYTSFILEIAEKDKLIVISAPLPTITDGNDWGEVADQRKEVTTSQKDRTKLTVKFNSTIQKMCRENSIGYINLDEECMGENGIVDSFYMHPNPIDHHYHPRRYIALLSKRITEYFEKSGE
jgi:hypothetical protein